MTPKALFYVFQHLKQRDRTPRAGKGRVPQGEQAAAAQSVAVAERVAVEQETPEALMHHFPMSDAD